jgi:hypothetical protein
MGTVACSNIIGCGEITGMFIGWSTGKEKEAGGGETAAETASLQQLYGPNRAGIHVGSNRIWSSREWPALAFGPAALQKYPSAYSSAFLACAPDEPQHVTTEILCCATFTTAAPRCLGSALQLQAAAS